MNHLRPVDFAVIGAYMLGVLAMGFRFARRQKTTEEYFVARRSIPAWALGISMFATIITSLSFIAYPGNAYAGDWTELVPGLTGLGVIIVVAAALIPFFRHVVRMSAYEYFERRFNYGTRIYGSLMFMVGHLAKMGFVTYLVSLTIQSLTGWNIYRVIASTGLVTVSYTCIGGIEAVIWIEVIQGFILWIGLLICLAFLLFLPRGGPADSLHLAWASHKISLGSLDFDLTKKGVWVMVLYGLFFYLQKYSTDQTTVQRYLVAKSDRAAIKGVAIGALLCVPVWTLFLLVGSLTWAFYRLSGEALPASLTKADQIFPYFLSTHIPAGLAGVIMASLFASAMSGLSSDLNCLAVVGVEDFYAKLHPAASDGRKLAMGRLGVIAAGGLFVLVAILLAHTTGAALTLYFTVTSIVAGGLFGLFFLAFMTTRANIRGIWIGIAASLLFTIYATVTNGSPPLLDLPGWNFRWQGVTIGAVGNLVMIAVGYTASLLFPPPAATVREITLWGWLERKSRS